MASHRNNRAPPSPAAVVMVPLPLQGHLNQLLHLSRLISNHNIPVHFVSTTTHCRQAKLRVQGWDPLAVATIHFHEFQTPTCISSPPSNPNNSTKFPSHLQPLCEATATHLRQPVATLLRKLSATTRRLVIIHDSLMGSVIQDFVTLPNTESYTFHSVSAFTISLYTLRTIRIKQLENLTKPQALTNDHLSFEGCFTSEFKKFTATQHEYAELNSGRIYNSCRIIEQPMLDLLENEERNRSKKLWALGPFNPVDFKRTTKRDKGYGCLKWLDKQESNTVIFVSFGTTTSFTKQQITELAIGLEKCGHKFIWALRDADKSDVFSDCITRVELPKGYEERIKGRGLVVREWAPQLEILAHRATGGFMSHCGWNSCMESISMGVPIVAWPIHSDQPTNTVLVTEILKVGLTVKDWECRDEIVVAEDVEKAVRKLMGTKEGAEIRRRAVEMGGGVRRSVREGGVSWLQLQSFIAHITR